MKKLEENLGAGDHMYKRGSDLDKTGKGCLRLFLKLVGNLLSVRFKLFFNADLTVQFFPKTV